VEGIPGQQLMRSVEDVAIVLEACFANEVDGPSALASVLLIMNREPGRWIDRTD
jgi:hypothetical protein